MSRRKKLGLSRLWQLVTLLDGTKRGRTVTELAERMEVSVSTLYRYLHDLDRAGVGFDKSVVNGEVRYRLLGSGVPPIVPTPLQLAALHFARGALAALEGTEMIEQLDALLGRWGVLKRDRLAVTRKAGVSAGPALLRTLDEALRTRRRLALEYRGAKDEVARRREVDPVVLHVNEDVPYLLGYDHGRADYRVFKVARIAAAQVLPSPALDHSGVDANEVFARSIKVWHSEGTEKIIVRLSAAVARFAREYPLMPDHVIESFEDGSALVRAEARGIKEALRWVLSWGAEAEAIAPQALREAVRREVEGARARYAAGPKVRGVKRGVAREVRRAGRIL